MTACLPAPVQMSYDLTMLAYEMNGEPLSFGHGAPCGYVTKYSSVSSTSSGSRASSSSNTSVRSEAASEVTTRTTSISGTASRSNRQPAATSCRAAPSRPLPDPHTFVAADALLLKVRAGGIPPTHTRGWRPG